MTASGYNLNCNPGGAISSEIKGVGWGGAGRWGLGVKGLTQAGNLTLFYRLVSQHIKDGRRSCCRSRRQEGTPQVQAEDRSYLQEQGPQARPEGVRGSSTYTQS